MKIVTKLVIALSALALSVSSAIAAPAYEALPFDVTIGGNKAVQTDATPTHATLPGSVAADAALEFGSKTMVIVNVTPSDKEGAVAAGAPAKVIIAQNGSAN